MAASGVLVAFRPSTYRKGTPRVFTDCGLAGQPFCASCDERRFTRDERWIFNHRLVPSPTTRL